MAYVYAGEVGRLLEGITKMGTGVPKICSYIKLTILMLSNRIETI